MSSPARRFRIRPEIAALPPYRQGRQAGVDAFKLSSNENPFAPIPEVVEAVRATADHINSYPDAAAPELVSRIAEVVGVDETHVHVGAGSVALLQQLVLAVATPDAEIVFPWRSFEAYPGLVTVAGARSVMVPNQPDGSHDVDALIAAVTDKTAVLILCSPNNPTGTVVDPADIARVLRQVPSDVIVALDEAYIEFVAEDRRPDTVRLLSEHDNLAVFRTFSKAYGLAGLRVGYCMGNPEVIAAMRATATPLSLTRASVVAALASLRESVWAQLQPRVRAIASARDELQAALASLGFSIPRAHGNFVWFATGEHTRDAEDVFLSEGCVVRAFDGAGIRVSIGTPEAQQAIVRAAATIASRFGV